MRIWRNWNSDTLLVGVYKGTVTLENNVAILKILNTYLPIDCHSTPRWNLPKTNESICSMVIADLFVITNNWKQPKYQQVNDKWNMLCSYSAVLVSSKNEYISEKFIMSESQNYYILSKHDSHYIILWNQTPPNSIYSMLPLTYVKL